MAPSLPRRVLAAAALAALAATSASAGLLSRSKPKVPSHYVQSGHLSAKVLKTLVADEPNQRLHELGELSDSDTVRTRAYLGTAHGKAAAMVKAWMEGAGLETRTDALGNVRGVLAGNGTAAAGANAGKRWLLGSHFDTAVEAGAFDGPLGVALAVAAVEAAVAEAAVAAGLVTNAALAKALKAGKRVKDALPADTKLSSLLATGVEVVAFADNEGVRFGGPMASSAALVGDYVGRGLYDRVDAKGVTLASALKSAGIKSSRSAVADLAIPAEEVVGYLEVHVEGYDSLERMGAPLGVVEAAAGATYMLFTVTGDEASLTGHQSLVPMAERKDAMAGAAEAILNAERACKAAAKEAGEDGAPHGVLCGTGFLSTAPNAPLNIARQVNFTVGVTSTSDEARTAAIAGIRARIDALCTKRGLTCSGGVMMEYPAAPVPESLVERLMGDASDALKELPSLLDGGADPPAGSPSLAINLPTLWTGTDTDVLNLARRFPAGALFVRHRRGITHSLAEHVEPADVAAAGAVLHKFVSRQLLAQDPLELEAVGGGSAGGAKAEGKAEL
jgi:allantoate deiminase